MTDQTPGNAPTPSHTETSHKYFHDGKKFYVPSGDRWVAVTDAAFKTHLMTSEGGGFRNYTSDNDGGVKPVEREALRVMTDCRVDWAGELAGVSSGIHDQLGKRVLVTRSPNRIEPVEGEFPTIQHFLDCIFYNPPPAEDDDDPEDECDQRPYWNGWLAHAVRAYYRGVPNPGAAMAIAGAPACGKTSGLKWMVREIFGGGEGRPFQYMTGADSFNSDHAKYVLQVIDDEGFDWKTMSRAKLGSQVKQITSADGQRIREMHKSSEVVSSLARLLLLLNDEPECLLVLPPMTSDISGKILLLKAYFPEDHPLRDITAKAFEEWQQKLKTEIPAYVHWLLNADDERWRGRFGVEIFHHPVIDAAQFQVSSEAAILDCLDRFYFHAPSSEGEIVTSPRCDQPFEKSAKEIWTDLVETEPDSTGGLPKHMHGKFLKLGTHHVLARKLGDLQHSLPDRITRRKTRSGNLWRLIPPMVEGGAE